MRTLDDTTALVTGAGSGIGRATALALAKAGARLILCDIDADRLAAVETELPPGRCRFTAVVDVSDRAAMEALAARVHGEVDALDVLVNNAGVGLAGGVCDTSLEDWEWVLSVNLWGVIHGCNLFVPPMVDRGRGHVVNISSLLGYFGQPGAIGYVTSKFAVFGLSESMRNELAPLGVGVSTICPGLVRTNIIQDTRFGTVDDPEGIRSSVDALYVKRNYGPEKVAAAVVKAIRRNKSVVPVTPESWALYGLKRILPGLTGPVGRWMKRQSGGG